MNSILENFTMEKEKLQEQYNENLLKIQEYQSFLDDMNSEEEETRIFSPRSKEHQYKDQIEDAYKQISELNSLNFDIQKSIDKYDGFIEELLKPEVEVLSVIEQTNTPNYDLIEKVSELEKNRLRFYSDKKMDLSSTHLIRKLNYISDFLSLDPMRAKLEFQDFQMQLNQFMNSIHSGLNSIFIEDGYDDSLYFQENVKQYLSIVNEYKHSSSKIDISVEQLDKNVSRETFRLIKDVFCFLIIDAQFTEYSFSAMQLEHVLVIEIQLKDYICEEINSYKEYLQYFEECLSCLNGKFQSNLNDSKIDTRFCFTLPI